MVYELIDIKFVFRFYSNFRFKLRSHLELFRKFEKEIKILEVFKTLHCNNLPILQLSYFIKVFKYLDTVTS